MNAGTDGDPVYADLDAQASASATTLELNQIPDETLKAHLFLIYLQELKTLGKSAIETAQELVDKGIGTYNNLNKTITIPGLGEIDVGKTLGGLALNTIAGAPISLAMYAMQQIPKSQSQIDYDNFSDEKKAAVDSIYGPGGVMEGYNAVSALGEGVDATIQKRIDDFQKNYTAEELAAMSPTGIYNKLLDAKEKTGGTGINPNDQIDIDNQINLEKELDETPPDTTPIDYSYKDPIMDMVDTDLPTGTTPIDYSYKDPIMDMVDTDLPTDDFPDNDPAPSAPPSDPYRGGEGGVQSGMNTPSAPKESSYDAEAQDDQYESAAYDSPNTPAADTSLIDAAANYQIQPTNSGSDSGPSNSKIVCTMMNESYGFGSFRNKIWMKFHKDIAPEYQKGYHKIFLPLVKLSKTNKIVKKILEHIAVHSTIDMRQATRGKTHLLGRVYRKIILPLCYWAGKND